MKISSCFSVFLLIQVQIILYFPHYIHFPLFCTLLCVLEGWRVDCIIEFPCILASDWVRQPGHQEETESWQRQISGWSDLVLPEVGLAVVAFLCSHNSYQIGLLHGFSFYQPLATTLFPLVPPCQHDHCFKLLLSLGILLNLPSLVGSFTHLYLYELLPHSTIWTLTFESATSFLSGLWFIQ